jgi:hypothetical protein
MAAPRLRRLTAVAGAATLTAATLLVSAPSASAAAQDITGATFEWSLSDYFQHSVAGLQGGAPCPTISAGYLETTNPGNGTGQLGTGSTFKSSEGTVTILKNGVEPTFADQCTGSVAAAPGATGLNKKVVWSGGTGTRDSVTGAATISFTGMLSLKLSGSPARIVDPVLTVNPDGTGTLKASSVISGHSPSDPLLKTTNDVTVAVLSGIDADNSSGFTTDPPLFAGETVTVGGTTFPSAAVQSAYTAAGLTAGTWPQSWIDAVPDATQGGQGEMSRYYNTGTTAAYTDQVKKPNPITVTYGSLSGGDPGQNIGVTVPVIGCTGELSITVSSTDSVSMGTATLTGDRLRATGIINPVTITDTRQGNQACRPAFAVSGSVSEFTAPSLPNLSAGYLGWQPNLDSGAVGLVAGPTVAPGYLPASAGLSEPSILVSADEDTTGSGSAGADLTLELPPTTQPGDYQGTLTLTGLT